MSKSFHIFTDGGARGNPGPAAIGFYISDLNNQTIVKTGKYIGRTTNNVAEYTAVIESLKWIKENTTKENIGNLDIEYFLDSQLVVNQLMGIYKVKDSKLKTLIILVKELEKYLRISVNYHLIPREKNIIADSLVNQTLDRTTSVSRLE